VPALEHPAEVRSAAFSPDGTRVVTADSDGAVRVWNASTGQLLNRSVAHHAMNTAFSPDGTKVVILTQDGTTHVWDTTLGPIREPAADDAALEAAAHESSGVASAVRRTFQPTLVPRGEFAGDEDLFDVTNSRTDLLHIAPHGLLEREKNAVLSPDGTRVAIEDGHGIARVCDAATGQPVTGPLTSPYDAMRVAFSPDGTRVVIVTRDGIAQVWDAATSQLRTSLLTPRTVSAAVSSDGTRVVVVSEDHTAQVWDVATDKPLGSALVHQAAVRHAAFSPDGTRVVTASEDQTARVWDAATGKPLSSPLMHQGTVVSAAFSLDGTRVVTASLDKTAGMGRHDREAADWTEVRRG